MYGSLLAPEQQVPVPAPAALAIVRYDDERGYYLLYLDAEAAWLRGWDSAQASKELEVRRRP